MKVKELDFHCGECPDNIYSLCEYYCNYLEDKASVCEQERFADMDINEYEKINEILINDKLKER